MLSRFFRISLFVLTAHQIGINGKDNQFILITSLYNEQDLERAAEYILCLQFNLHNRHIKKIHVVYDDSQDEQRNGTLLHFLNKKNLEVTYHKGRPTYAYMFALAQERYLDERIIVSNADIYFNHTLAKLEGYDLSNKFLALTRWNVQPNGELAPHIRRSGNPAIYSQDSWIFETPLIPIENIDIEIGTYYCDNRLSYQVHKAGLTVLNPCLSIQCCHLHLCHIRHYEKGHPTPHRMPVPWSYLKESSSTGNPTIKNHEK